MDSLAFIGTFVIFNSQKTRRMLQIGAKERESTGGASRLAAAAILQMSGQSHLAREIPSKAVIPFNTISEPE
jgi:hypothetical protein